MAHPQGTVIRFRLDHHLHLEVMGTIVQKYPQADFRLTDPHGDQSAAEAVLPETIRSNGTTILACFVEDPREIP